MLQARRRVLGDESDPIILLAPDPIRGWLDSYDHRVEPISPEYRLFSNSQLVCIHHFSPGGGHIFLNLTPNNSPDNRDTAERGTVGPWY